MSFSSIIIGGASEGTMFPRAQTPEHIYFFSRLRLIPPAGRLRTEGVSRRLEFFRSPQAL